MDNIKWPNYNIKLNLYEEIWNIDLDLIINEHQNKFNFENLGELLLKIKKNLNKKKKINKIIFVNFVILIIQK